MYGKAADRRPRAPQPARGDPGRRDQPCRGGRREAGSLCASPRTIGDITTILDSETPDTDKIAKAKAEADAQPPTGASRRDLAWFYYTRGSARAQLGRLKDSIADAEQAVEVARGATDANFIGRLEQLLGMQYLAAGRPRQALAVYARQVRETDAPGARRYQFNGNQQLAAILILMGDLAQAEAYLRRGEALIREARTSGLPNWRRSYAQLGQSWEASVEATRAMIYEARGQFRKAEAAYVLAERRRRASIPGVLRSRVPALWRSCCRTPTAGCSARRAGRRGKGGSPRPRSMPAVRCSLA